MAVSVNIESLKQQDQVFLYWVHVLVSNELAQVVECEVAFLLCVNSIEGMLLLDFQFIC